MKCLNFSKIAMFSLVLTFGAFSLFSCTTNDDTTLAEETDTVINFDPETKEERIQLVKRMEDSPAINTEKHTTGTIDTVITFDPETMKETMTIVRNDQ